MIRVIIDTNILLLYVVGLASPDYIAKHKRLGGYSTQDYRRLATFLSDKMLILTPNTITETSNLLRSGPQTPVIGAAMGQIAALLMRSGEQYVPSRDPLRDEIVLELGITDVVLLTLARNGDLLLTVDQGLINQARRAKLKVVDARQLLSYRA